jgi:hypothetical protein
LVVELSSVFGEPMGVEAATADLDLSLLAGSPFGESDVETLTSNAGLSADDEHRWTELRHRRLFP